MVARKTGDTPSPLRGDNESMARILRTTIAGVAAALCLAGGAQAAGGNYVFVGGSDEARDVVREALEASRFDWDRVPGRVTIEISRCGCAGARPGVILLDEDVLVRSPFGTRYAWGIVQHEYAHQVDFLLLGARERRTLRRVLGGSDWCYERSGLAHDDHACERFATMVAWSYWPSRDNVERPGWAPRPPMRQVAFRKLVNRLAAQAAARRSPALQPVA